MMPGYIMPLANHLWQSTLFAAAAGLLTLALRGNRAAVRYRLWLAASLKFLVPFGLLVSAASHLPSPVAPAPTATVRPLSSVVQGIEQTFTPLPSSAPEASSHPLLFVLPVIWFAGFLVAGISWFGKWLEVRRVVRAATPVDADLPVPVRVTRARLEPGVVGILHPILLLPEGIHERLNAQQLSAVLAHEMCHVRRRDNLAVALHLAVETIFWFHPMLWWIRERLLDERERACDEAVLHSGSDPEAYAEGILSVCRLYLESPVACASGVTGADLKKRVATILSCPLSRDLDPARKVLLASAVAVALALPVALGLLHADVSPVTRFEVASVKSNTSPDPRAMKFQTLPGGRLTVTNIPLYWIIAEAYGVAPQSLRLSGGPEWTHSSRYDIEAKAEDGVLPPDLPGKVREERMRPMLQALLAERFKLVVRRESKEMPVYALKVAKGGPRFQKSTLEEKDCGGASESGILVSGVPCHVLNGGQGRGVHGRAVDMADLIGFVENWTDRPMIDRTGLSGLFQMDSDGWVPMRGPGGGDAGLDDPVRPTIFTIFEKQLGLKLESDKAPVDVFIIDHVEKPTGN